MRRPFQHIVHLMLSSITTCTALEHVYLNIWAAATCHTALKALRNSYLYTPFLRLHAGWTHLLLPVEDVVCYHAAPHAHRKTGCLAAGICLCSPHLTPSRQALWTLLHTRCGNGQANIQPVRLPATMPLHHFAYHTAPLLRLYTFSACTHSPPHQQPSLHTSFPAFPLGAATDITGRGRAGGVAVGYLYLPSCPPAPSPATPAAMPCAHGRSTLISRWAFSLAWQGQAEGICGLGLYMVCSFCMDYTVYTAIITVCVFYHYNIYTMPCLHCDNLIVLTDISRVVHAILIRPFQVCAVALYLTGTCDMVLPEWL